MALLTVRRGNEGIITVSEEAFRNIYQPAGFRIVGDSTTPPPAATSTQSRVLVGPTGQRVVVSPSFPDYQGYLAGGFSPNAPSGASNTQSRIDQLQQIEGTNPDLIANKEYVNAVVRALRGRDANAAELANLVGRKTGDVLRVVRGGAIFNQPAQAFTETTEGRRLAQFSSAPPITAQPAAVDTETGLTGVYAGLFNTLKTQLDELQRRGQVINPNVNIDASRLAEFQSIAAREIDPFYANLLKTTRDELLQGIGFGQNEIAEFEKDIERRYGRQVRQLGEQAAEAGFAQSGLRARGERELAEDVQSNLNARRRQLNFQTGQALRGFAREFGTAQTPNVSLPLAPRALPGEPKFAPTTASSPFYELAPEIYAGLQGERQFEQAAAKRRRALELEELERSGLALQQTRQLNF